MSEEETENDKPTHIDSREELFRTLRKAALQVADDLRVGLQVDCWGGALFYAYVLNTADTKGSSMTH